MSRRPMPNEVAMTAPKQAQEQEQDKKIGKLEALLDRYGVSTALLVFVFYFGWQNFLEPMFTDYRKAVGEISRTNTELKQVAREVGDKNAALIEKLTLDVETLRDAVDSMARDTDASERRISAAVDRLERMMNNQPGASQ